MPAAKFRFGVNGERERSGPGLKAFRDEGGSGLPGTSTLGLCDAEALSPWVKGALPIDPPEVFILGP